MALCVGDVSWWYVVTFRSPPQHPSKNTKDKRLRKIKEEIEKAKQATTDSKAGTSIDAMKKVQVCCTVSAVIVGDTLLAPKGGDAHALLGALGPAEACADQRPSV